MRKPFVHALAAALYIVIIVSSVNFVTMFFRDRTGTIIIPMTMLSLFVLSAAVMGFLFLSEPIALLIENKKQEAIVFFAKVTGFFACFLGIFLIALYLS